MREYKRFTGNQRWQHIILLTTFTLLVITGLPMKYRWEWGQAILKSVGYVTIKSIHKWAAIGMTSVGVYHVIWYVFIDRGKKKIIPTTKDITDFGRFIKFKLGISEEYPKFDRFNFVQKFDYWGAFWGMAIMIITGIVMWKPDLFPFLSITVRESLRIAHSEEAVLAAVFVFTIHIYTSHLRREVFPFDKVFLTGKLPEERMKEEHPLEYEELTKKEV